MTNIIPAAAGYFALNADIDEDGDECSLCDAKALIVGWRLGVCGTEPVIAGRGLSWQHNGVFDILCPDGSVYSTNAQRVAWDSEEEWRRERIKSRSWIRDYNLSKQEETA